MRRIVTVIVLGAALLLYSPSTSAGYSDGDSDKVEDEDDNCRGAANPLQFDIDGDGEGDLCERPVLTSDTFAGTPGTDLVFGRFGESVLSGAGGSDALYGGPGDDRLDGGDGPDALIGGPGDDVLTGGEACDVFAIHLGIIHRDVITDFTPGIDRFRFPPRSRDPNRDVLPPVESGRTEHLEVTFVVDGSPTATIVLEGIGPRERIYLATGPCGESPPPPDICPGDGDVLIGAEDLFCPSAGGLRIDTGIYATRSMKIVAKQPGEAERDNAYSVAGYASSVPNLMPASR